MIKAGTRTGIGSRVRELLQESTEPLTVGQIAEELESNEGSVKGALQNMRKQGKAMRMHGHKWILAQRLEGTPADSELNPAANNLSVPNQIVLALVDDKVLSTKQIKRLLNNIPENSIGSALWRLKAEGIIEHNGYQRWSLTEEGNERASQIFSHSRPAPKAKEPATEEDQQLPSNPPQRALTVSDPGYWEEQAKFWQTEYIRLANNIAIGRNK